MKRIALFAAFLLAWSVGVQAQSVKVRVRVILVDSELNQKPVPFVTLAFKSAGKSAQAKTGLDGSAEANLAPGTYTVTNAKPVVVAGKRYSWAVKVAVEGAEKTVDLTNENAREEEIAEAAAAAPSHSRGGSGGDLTDLFKKLKNTVVTVISESGHGTGFIVDGKGLILTNEHVVGKSDYLAVQFDRQRKVAAQLIASDAKRDVALLWVNLSALPGAAPVTLVRNGTVEEGERVFTIGSPLSLDKIITTGIVSKVDTHTLMSDININPGNSGGPLFDNAGHVIGLTTFGTAARSGPGVSGVVRIEEALPLLDENRSKAAGTPPPAALLPVEPQTPYPVEGLKAALQGDKFDPKPYYFNAGDFHVAISTPPFDYREKEEDRLRAERTQKKRNKKNAQQPEDEGEDTPREWEGDAGGNKAVLVFYALPMAKEGIGSRFTRGLTNGFSSAKVKFKTDFQSMKLFCGDKEVQPILPGRVPVTVNVRNAAVRMEDSTYKGVYSYGPDAVNPDCGTVKIAIYSSKGDEPVIKELPGGTVDRIWADFDAYRQAAAEGGKKKR